MGTQAPREAQQLRVAREQGVGTRGHRDLDEHLVVGVTAARQALGGRGRVDAPCARRHPRGDLRPALAIHGERRVGEHALELGLHACIHRHDDGARGQCTRERQHAGVVEEVEVEPDVGIEHHDRRRSGYGASSRTTADAYATIKVLAQTQGRRHFHIAVNLARKPGEGRAVRQQLQQVIDRYVNPALEAPVRLELLGEIPADPAVRECVQRRQLLLQTLPGTPAAAALGAIATKLLT